MLDLYIVGAGGLGRGLADALTYDNKKNIKEEYGNVYFIDDSNVGKKINDIYVKYNINDFVSFGKECLVINALGTASAKKEVQDKLNSNPKFIFPNYIDHQVKIYKNITLGKGNIITQGVVFSTNIDIGDFNLIHFNCTIGHDVKMGDYNCVYPLTSLSGYTTLGDCNMVGASTTSLPNVVIENDVEVGANSLLRGSYKSKITVVGSPAERLK